MIDAYFKLGEKEKGRTLAVAMRDELIKSVTFFRNHYDIAAPEFEYSAKYLYILGDVLQQAGEKELADGCTKVVTSLLGVEE